MDLLTNSINDLIDLSGGDVNKMYNIIYGTRKSGKTYEATKNKKKTDITISKYKKKKDNKS